MGIFDNAQNVAPISAARGRQTAAQDRPQAKLWLNVGYNVPQSYRNPETGEMEDRFVNLPVGIPVDTMESLAIRGQNADWATFQSSRNELLKALQAKGNELEPGEEVEVTLTVRLRRSKDAVEAVSTEDSPYTVPANLFGKVG